MLKLIRRSILLLLLGVHALLSWSQCGTPVSVFPYNEGFETNNGNWTAGGTGSDWAWGTPSKATISSAGGGTRCWIVGGLTGSGYTNNEASWLQSPCFDMTNLAYPYISFKINWDTEQQFDGASFQYTIDNGATWFTIGPANYTDCVQKNWFNQDPVTYLSPLTSERRGWSGNMQATSGSCRGGNGSGGWVTASTIAPGLAARPNVRFRFIFGAGSICNNYDGVAIDDIYIGEAPPNQANFTFTCVDDRTVNFTNTSTQCPTSFSWNFGDPASSSNTSTAQSPSHIFSGPGTYTVTLTVAGIGSAPSTITKEVTILSVNTSLLAAADCQTNSGGSAMATVTGTTATISYSWNSNPVQTTATAINLASGAYEVTVQAAGACDAAATITVPFDNSCTGIFFPSAFTPNGDGLNDGFGVLGGIGAITSYKLSVYNRWGQLVFQTTNPAVKWNGTFKGVKADSNVFVWQAEITQLNAEPERRKGVVTIIR